VPLLICGHVGDADPDIAEDITAEGIKSHLDDLYDQIDSEKLLPFPVDALPLPIQGIITATHETLKFPIDYIGAAILFAASLMIGNTHRVRIKKTWTEKAVLYMALVGHSGVSKSPPLSWALSQIEKHDDRTYKDYNRDKAEYNHFMSLNKKEKEAQGKIPLQKPVWERLILSDTTQEAMVKVHQENPRGIGICPDELNSLVLNFNKYNKGSEQESYMSNWSGKPIIIDRKTDDPVSIRDPFISVIGTIQRKVLYKLGLNNRLDNGFIDRFLMVVPEGLQKEYWSEDDVDVEIIGKWNTIADHLMGLPYLPDEGDSEGKILEFSQEAKDLLYAWQRHNTDISKGTEDDFVQGICAKLDIYICRFSLILQLLRWATREAGKERIEVEAVKGAISFAEYFRKMNARAIDIIKKVDPLEGLGSDKRALYVNLPGTFSTKEGNRISKQFTIAERTAHRFFGEKQYFEHIKHGIYKKKY